MIMLAEFLKVNVLDIATTVTQAGKRGAGGIGLKSKIVTMYKAIKIFHSSRQFV